MRTTWAVLAGAVVTEVLASLSLKAALLDPGWYVLVVVGYVCAFALLRVVLRRGMPLGVAYGVWGACGVVLTAVLGVAIFSETLSLISGTGIALIIVGVLVMGLNPPHCNPARAG